MVGHTLGAAGAMEAGFCWLMLRDSNDESMRLPPHAYDGQPDPALSKVTLAEIGAHCPVGPVMSNSFGFGGNNCTLILAGGRL